MNIAFCVFLAMSFFYQTTSWSMEKSNPPRISSDRISYTISVERPPHDMDTSLFIENYNKSKEYTIETVEMFKNFIKSALAKESTQLFTIYDKNNATKARAIVCKLERSGKQPHYYVVAYTGEKVYLLLSYVKDHFQMGTIYGNVVHYNIPENVPSPASSFGFEKIMGDIDTANFMEEIHNNGFSSELIWAVPELVDSNSLLDKPFLKFYWW